MSAQQQPDASNTQRSYTEIQLGRCHVQTAEDRFGPRAHEAITAREEFPGFNTGPLSQTLLWPANDTGNSDAGGEPVFTVPSCARLRGNLTALSNDYNLYFAAYQDHIFIYRLRSAAAANLPRHPDAKIKCKPTKEGALIRGHVDRQLGGRSINHIITGFLGEEEILLICTDKGDVFAHYTKVIASQVFDRAHQRTNPADCPSSFEPFFQENVGKSAWGLAIHRRSRLMAVSSNRWEVTVFAPALTKPPMVPEKRAAKMSEVEKTVRDRKKNMRIVIGMPAASHNMPNICFLDDEQGFAEKVGGTDIDGHAWIADIWKPQTPVRRVLRNCARSFSSEEFQGDTSKGWGLMAFQDHHFMKVRALEELVGVPRVTDDKSIRVVRNSLGEAVWDSEDDINEKYFKHIQDRERDASSCMSKDLRGLLEFVPDNPCRPSESSHIEAPQNFNYLPDDPQEQAFFMMNDFPNWSPEGSEGVQTQDIPQNNDSLAGAELSGTFVTDGGNLAGLSSLLDPEDLTPNEDGMVTITVSEPPVPLAGLHLTFEKFGLGHRPRKDGQHGQGDSDDSHESLYYPHLGTIEPLVRNTTTSARPMNPPRRNQIPHNSFEHWKDDDADPSYILLRTYEKDIEFTQPTSRHAKNWEMNLYYSSALHCKNHWETATTDLFFGTSRINMLFHIPELCIVVLGSPSGRVIVATLTKLAKPRPDASGTSLWNRGMRIEWILPRESDEKKYRPLRDARPLHGLAVGRIPGTAGDPTSPQRWRIILHYQNHLMLSYEITRKEQTEKLCIF